MIQQEAALEARIFVPMPLKDAEHPITEIDYPVQRQWTPDRSPLSGRYRLDHFLNALEPYQGGKDDQKARYADDEKQFARIFHKSYERFFSQVELLRVADQ
jgi:hypothetical protein